MAKTRKRRVRQHKQLTPQQERKKERARLRHKKLSQRNTQTRNAKRVKNQSLQIKLSRAVNRLNTQLLHEQAMKEARGRGTIETVVKTPFKKLDYKTLMKEGITRKVNGKVVHYTGAEAVREQIESINRRANPISQKQIFIQNYKIAMGRSYYEQQTMTRVEQLLNRLTPDELSDIIESGELPSVSYIYSEVLQDEQDDDEMLIEKIERLVNNVKQDKRDEKLRERAEKYKPYIKERMQI